jgi:hypothetical protein
MQRSIQLIAYALFLVALVTWGGVYLAAARMRADAVSLSASASNAQAQEDRIAYQKRIASLARETADERARVDDIVSLDIVSIVKKIEAAGKTLRLTVSVNDAQASGAAQELASGDSLHAVTFLVESQGSYAALMQLEELFENLPLASSVDGLELQSLEGAAMPWHLTARIRVFTTSAISS